MAFTQIDLDALDVTLLALAGGARSVRYGNREVTNHDLSDLLALRGLMLGEVVVATGSSTSYRVAATSKGV